MNTFNGKMYNRKFMGRYNNLSSVYADILPNDIKEIFQWSEFINANVPVVASALEKMSSVSITTFQYVTDDLSEVSPSDEKSWKSILEDELDMKDILKELAFTYLLYGNLFVSVYTPIKRTMTCLSCQKILHERQFNDNSKLKPSMEEISTGKGKKKTRKKTLVFKGVCPDCSADTIFTHADIPVNDISGINVVNWPGQNMNIITDDITGKSSFYYKMPNSKRKMITDGFLSMLFSQPIDLIQSAVENTMVFFDNDKILHLRRKKMIGVNSGWGMPILTSAIPEMISLLLLRKSQEKILSDMIFPFRGLVPRTSGADGNPMYNYMSGSDVNKRVETLLTQHKNDPTSIKYFPIPLDTMTAFGEGKTLNLAKEIDEVSVMAMNSIGVPVEFVKGGLGYNAAGASIRVLENQLMNLTTSMEKIANFTVKKVAVMRKKKAIPIKITPFRIVDDISEKQILLQLFQSGKISDHTMGAYFTMNATSEQTRMTAEAKENAKRQIEIQEFTTNLSQNLEEKAKTEAMLSQSSTQQVNQQAIMQEADQMAQQLSQMEAGQRKSEMDRLQKENWLLYVATKERMEFNGRKDATQAAQQAQQQGQQ